MRWKWLAFVATVALSTDTTGLLTPPEGKLPDPPAGVTICTTCPKTPIDPAHPPIRIRRQPIQIPSR